MKPRARTGLKSWGEMPSAGNNSIKQDHSPIADFRGCVRRRACTKTTRPFPSAWIRRAADSSGRAPRRHGRKETFARNHSAHGGPPALPRPRRTLRLHSPRCGITDAPAPSNHLSSPFHSFMKRSSIPHGLAAFVPAAAAAQAGFRNFQAADPVLGQTSGEISGMKDIPDAASRRRVIPFDPIQIQ